MFSDEKLKPEFVDSGLNGYARCDLVAPITLAEPQNLLQMGTLMTTGFIQIPRSLLSHPTVRTCSDSYFRILFTIIENLAFAPCQQDDHGKLIDLQPGQFMCTDRELEKLTGSSDSTCRRAIARFESVGIMKQEVKHTKKIITFTHLDTCNLIKNGGEAAREAKAKQKRSTKEECNKANKKNTPSSYSLSSIELLSFFDAKAKELWNPIAKPRPAKDAAYFEKLLQVADPETIKKVIIFAFTDEFWKGQIQTPKKLVEGSQDNPDRFAILLHKINTIKGPHERNAKHPTGSPEPQKRRANELIV
jgi:hypothetical protein